LPIVFSLGARVENVPLRAFLSNPTKISNALRRMHSHLRSDGISCYFDACLEAEALGAELHWETEDQAPELRWPASAGKGKLPEGLRSPEEAARSSRVLVAIEVIRRLKTVLRGDMLLMAGVTGPFTLAARITQLDHEGSLQRADLPDSALELAAAVITRVSSAFVEAGADLIFILEPVLPALSAGSCSEWAGLLAPAFNIIRFYEALPVLHLLQSCSFAESNDVIFQRPWDCILCCVLDRIPCLRSERFSQMGATALGVAMPHDSFQADEPVAGGTDLLCRAISRLRPVLLTTAGDVPAGTDIKRLLRVFEHVPRGA
jgi:uroporphyrinogen decarboxylase-like protein